MEIKPFTWRLCDGKKQFETRDDAHEHVDESPDIPDSLKLRKKNGVRYCKRCEAWHLGPHL